MEEKPDVIAEVTESVACCRPYALDLLPHERADTVARALKALGHPIRLQIMHILSRMQGRVCVCDIEAAFDVKQPTISHHLRSLRDAGLVDAEQRGLYMFYRIRPEGLAQVRKGLATLAG